MEKNEIMIIASFATKELWIPKGYMEKTKNLASEEAHGYFMMKALYPDYKEVIL